MKWFLIFLIQILILVSCGYLLTIYPGTFTVEWLGYQIEASLLVLFVAFILTFLTLGFINKLLSTIVHGPAWFKARSQKKGMQSLTQALSALWALDGRQVEKKAQDVRRDLRADDLAIFLEAEAAYVQGDLIEAQKRYQFLSASPEYQYLAYHGLARLSLKWGDEQKALQWANKAKDAYQNSRWARNIIVEHALKADDLPLALRELDAMLALKGGPTQPLLNQKATILLTMAEQEIQSGDFKTALEYAREAYDITDDKGKASVLYVDLLRQLKGEKKAISVIEETWALSPNPHLPDLYVDLMRPPSEEEKLIVIKRLASFAPHHPESFFITACAAIDAQQWDEARACLKHLKEQGYQPDRVLKLMTDLESAL